MDGHYEREVSVDAIIFFDLCSGVSTLNHLKKTKLLVVSGYSVAVPDGFTRTAQCQQALSYIFTEFNTPKYIKEFTIGKR